MRKRTNLYLLVGIRGDFRRRGAVIPQVDVEILHTLERWGVSPLPWGPCDSGSDLESVGDGVLRGWAHVDLRVKNRGPVPSDVPLSGLARTTWDALELFGTPTLTGIDADLPAVCAGDELWARLWSSSIRYDARATPERPRVLVQADFGKGSQAGDWEQGAIADELSTVVPIRAVGDDVPLASYDSGSKDHPFAPSGADAFRAEVELPAWTIDDAASAAEALAGCCHRVGVTQDVLIAVRLLSEERI